MWQLSLCGNKHKIMRYRKDWLACAATAVGSLGLLGSAMAQNATVNTWELASAVASEVVSKSAEGIGNGHIERHTPITDDGWSIEVPVVRQVVIARRPTTAPLSIDVFNEHGVVLDHIVWPAADGELKPLSLDALVAGRYAIRVSGAEHIQVIRFRRD